jgi:hypothetical protein
LVLVMRPATFNVRKWVQSIDKYWIEIDARNVLSGGPLAALDTNLPDSRTNCERCRR